MSRGGRHTAARILCWWGPTEQHRFHTSHLRCAPWHQHRIWVVSQHSVLQKLLDACPQGLKPSAMIRLHSDWAVRGRASGCASSELFLYAAAVRTDVLVHGTLQQTSFCWAHDLNWKENGLPWRRQAQNEHLSPTSGCDHTLPLRKKALGSSRT